MKHLTNDEILSYVSFNTLDDTNMKLSADIVLHIRHCNECLKRVSAFQNIYFQLIDSGRSDELAKLSEEFINDAEIDGIAELELEVEIENKSFLDM